MKSILALRHVEHEGLGLLEDILKRAELPCRYVDVFREPGFKFLPESCAGLVVLGGPMNVDQTDRYPFLAAETRWIADAIAADVPVLGICLGSQLLAKALGARVYASRVKEIGWYDVELTPAAKTDPLFSGCSPIQRVFQWHGDTFDLPRGAVQLARGQDCENQAFRYGDSAYALQFHLEVTPEIVATWLGEPDNCGELSALHNIDPAAIRRAAAQEIPAIAPAANSLFLAFAGLCRRRLQS